MGSARRPETESVWADSVEHPSSTSLNLRRESVRENAIISSHNLNVFITKRTLYYVKVFHDKIKPKVFFLLFFNFIQVPKKLIANWLYYSQSLFLSV